MQPYYLNINIQNMYHFNYGSIGVFLFLFASGCGLAYAHSNLDSGAKLKDFYVKRVLRIYPAYYTALLMAIVMIPSRLQNTFTPIEYVKIVTGFQSIGAHNLVDFYGKINGNLWFLSVILTMYLIFPILLITIKKHPRISILSLFIISAFSRYYLSFDIADYRIIDWFPLCRMFEFGLGICFISTGLYPRITSGRIIAYFSTISFYVFLINGPMSSLLEYPLVFIVALLVIGTMMYKFDELIKSTIRSFVARPKSASY